MGGAAIVHASRSVELRTRTANLSLAEEFGIARGSRTTQSVVQVELEHERDRGPRRGAPVYYRGETIDSAASFLNSEAPALVGEDPFALEAIGARLAGVGREAAARAALDAALHDWVGKRLSVPVWRLLGLAPSPRPRPTRSGSTASRAPATARPGGRLAGAQGEAGRRRGPRAARGCARRDPAPLRVDANEGWTLEAARELMPALVELGVELVEQPFPAADLDSFRALRELAPRPPVVVDEGCHDLRDVAGVAGYADAITVKLAKSGGPREALRMIHAARALGLRVMLGCMIESQLGIAPAARSPRSWTGSTSTAISCWPTSRSGLAAGRGPSAARRRPGPRRRAGACARRRGARVSAARLAIFAEGLFRKHTGKTGTA